ncbi:hypothetical protein AA313_de0200354 [Arthrobotrys entomopaga]|nr:hypothetical protein AA313_de0200354 [Arthrobotrys entomopaga]
MSGDNTLKKEWILKISLSPPWFTWVQRLPLSSSVNQSESIHNRDTRENSQTTIPDRYPPAGSSSSPHSGYILTPGGSNSDKGHGHSHQYQSCVVDIESDTERRQIREGKSRHVARRSGEAKNRVEKRTEGARVGRDSHRARGAAPFQLTGRALRAVDPSAADQRVADAALTISQSAQLMTQLFTELRGGKWSIIYNAKDVMSLGQRYCPRFTHSGQVGCRIKVVNGDCIDIALDMARRHQSEQSHMGDAKGPGDDGPYKIPMDNVPLLMNFANSHTPGGGFLNGAVAQEEAICHRTTLYETLHSEFYPLKPLEAIYSPFVAIIKDKNNKLYRWADEILHSGKIITDGGDADLGDQLLPKIAVVTISAPYRPKVREGKYADSQEKSLMRLKIKQTLRLAALYGHRRIVLGAFGCGVFANPPEEVAEMFLDILTKEKEFKGGWWKEVAFAVLDMSKNPLDAKSAFGVFHRTLDGQIC